MIVGVLTMKQSSRKLEREIGRWGVKEDPSDEYFASKRWNVTQEKKAMNRSTQTSARSNVDIKAPKRYIVHEWRQESGTLRSTMTARDPTKVNADGTLVKPLPSLPLSTSTIQSPIMSPSSKSSLSLTPKKSTSRSRSSKKEEEFVDEGDGNKATNTSVHSLKTELSLPSPLPPSLTSSPPKVVKTPTSTEGREETNKQLRKEHLKLDLKLVELAAKKKELEAKLRAVEGALEVERRKNEVPF